MKIMYKKLTSKSNHLILLNNSSIYKLCKSDMEKKNRIINEKTVR